MVAPLSLAKDISLGTALPSFSPGFVVYGIVIDNDTGNWLGITPGNYIVPPWTYGWSQPLGGTQSVSLSILAGPSIIPSVNAGTFVRALFTEERVPQSNGFTAITASNINNAVNIVGPVAITGNVGISGLVDVSGSTVVASISNAISIAGPVDVTGSSVLIGGPVDVSGSNVNAAVTGSVSISGGVTISSGTVSIGGTVDVSGSTVSATISNTVTITGNVAITSGTVAISGSVTVGTITAGNVNVNPGTFTLGGQGDAAINATGTAFQLSTSSVPTQVVMLKARSSNAGTIYVGKSTVTNTQSAAGARSTTAGLQLEPGDMIVFPATNLNAIYINGTSGDGVSYVYWT